MPIWSFCPECGLPLDSIDMMGYCCWGCLIGYSTNELREYWSSHRRCKRDGG